MTLDTAQLIIDHFQSLTSIAALVGSRIWFDSEIPQEVKYNPSRGAAILMTLRPARVPYVKGLKERGISTRVYGPSVQAIMAVCDRLDDAHASQRYRSIAVMDTTWQHIKEPDTEWDVVFAFWTMRLRVI